jgi:hypothetical protein
MTTKTQTSQLGKSLESSLIAGSESFNFELWATQVKQQMITSLQKNRRNSMS